jgi:hypothetical protein
MLRQQANFLDDHPAQYFPALKNTAVNNATLLNLGTYTAGGFPLQFPDQVTEQQDMLKYFQTWQPKQNRHTTSIFQSEYWANGVCHSFGDGKTLY